MPNVLLTPQTLAREAVIALTNRLPIGSHISRKVEGRFTASKIGDTAKVTIPPAPTDAQDFTGSTAADDVVETSVDVKLERHIYKRVNLTTKEASLELDDFTQLVLVPAMTGMGATIDKHFARKMRLGFARNKSGNIANRPTKLSHIRDAHKVLNDRFTPRIGRVALVDTDVEATLLSTTEFASRDFVDVPGAGQMSLGTKFGAEWVVDPHLGAFDRGDVAGTVKGAGTAKQNIVSLSAFTAATGDVKAGTAFVIAGNSQRFVVTEDAKISGNAATVTVFPALPDGFSPTDANVTFEAAGFENMLYMPQAVAGAIVAPEALWIGGQGSSANSYAYTDPATGITVRASFDGSIDTLVNAVVFDCFIGCEVVQPDYGLVIGGAA